MTCTCPAPGFCPTFNKEQAERHWLICRGEVLTPEKCEAYRQNWEGMAQRKRLCSHLGPEIRREECPTCSGKVQVKIFACSVFGETSLAKPLPGVQVCQGCPRYSSLAPRPAEAQNGEL
jgi:hypothetical protein